MVKITPEVHMVDGVMGGHVYMIVDDGITLIDTGMGGSEKPILKAINRIGYSPSDIKRIIITHGHLDHIGGLKALRDVSKATVMAGDADVDVVEGKKPIYFPKISPPINFLLFLIRPLFKHAPCKVNRRLNDGDTIPVMGGLVVVGLPGHSPGNIGLFCPSKRLLFSGDTVRMRNHEFTTPLNYKNDKVQCLASIKKMATLDYEIMLSGHDKPIMTGAAKKVASFAGKLS